MIIQNLGYSFQIAFSVKLYRYRANFSALVHKLVHMVIRLFSNIDSAVLM